jgi:hypothetical protein
MRSTVRDIRRIIREELERLDEMQWLAWRFKGGKRVGDPIEIEAENTREAGERAAVEVRKETGEHVSSDTFDVVPAPKRHPVAGALRKLDELVATLDEQIEFMESKSAEANEVAVILQGVADDFQKLVSGVSVTGMPVFVSTAPVALGNIVSDIMRKRSYDQQMIDSAKMVGGVLRNVRNALRKELSK